MFLISFCKANPVEYGHVFLMPYNVHQLPQSLDKKMFGLITQIAIEANNCTFRIFFDHSVSTCSDQIYFQVIILLTSIVC